MISSVRKYIALCLKENKTIKKYRIAVVLNATSKIMQLSSGFLLWIKLFNLQKIICSLMETNPFKIPSSQKQDYIA